MNDGNPAGERVWAVRGAIQAGANERDAILASTEELMRELMARNALVPEAIVSCQFTCTEDLDAEFPAVAVRGLGLDTVPLLCGREMNVPGSMPRVIRALVHYYGPQDRAPSHVYIGAASELRTDLQAAQ